MEIHQIRYFLALSSTLNFTRAAEACNVSQPALTRAIQALEAELGGELIRRERTTSHLTELGKRMLPLLQRCHDSAVGAKALAQAIASPEAGPVNAHVAHTVAIERVLASIYALFERFPKLHLRLSQGDAVEALAALKQGDVDIAVAGPLYSDWDRLDEWTLFEEGYRAIVPPGHPLANRSEAGPSDFAARPRVVQMGCEHRSQILDWLGASPTAQDWHEAASRESVVALVRSGVGVAIVPESLAAGEGLHALRLTGFEVKRTVSAYTIAGRPRSPPVNALLQLLRADAGARAGA